jgi:23S rRNA pseudouridine1911/1915/1917 synthase
LRVQLAHHDYPIYGDAKYGSVHTFGRAIGLHARSLTFLHPVRYEPVTLTAEVPRPWRGRFAYLLREGQT